MNNFEQAFLDQTNDGTFFGVRFVKKDGTLRVMNARRGVSQYVTGEGLAFDRPNKWFEGRMRYCCKTSASTATTTAKRCCCSSSSKKSYLLLHQHAPRTATTAELV